MVKRLLVASCVVHLCLVMAVASVGAQSVNSEQAASQDLLVRSEVETALSMLETISARQEQGKMTLADAKELGAALLRNLRYGTDGYFWADTTEGVNVVLYGRPDVEGRNRLQDVDQNGKFYVKEFLATGQAGGGYVEYLFVKKGQQSPQPKRSYVLLFAPFGWVVGSGYYR